MNSTAPQPIVGLSAIADRYRVVLCDVWGVVHNGVASWAAARDALARFRAGGGTVVLVTNAPRPHHAVRPQLAALGVEPECFDAVVTSGDVTRDLLAAHPGAKAFHLGAERDLGLYGGLDLTLVEAEEADLISCTGLFDDTVETPDDYQALLERFRARNVPMICANPDRVVERGHHLIHCAGALAERYRELGGSALIAGKPHRPIYEAALARAAEAGAGAVPLDRVLAIGDGAPTDLRGAVDFGLDVLFVTAGIHSADFGPADDPDRDAVHRFLAAERLGATAFIPRLAW